MIYEIAESVKKTVENNCDAYEIYIDESKTIELDSLKEELNFAKEEIDLGVGIRVLKDKKQGFAFTSNLDNLTQTAQKAIDNAKLTKIDDNYAFAEVEKVSEVKDVYDNKFNDLSLDEAVEFLKTTIETASDSGCEVTGSSFSASEGRSLIVNSNGVSIEDEGTGFGLGLSVTIQKDGEIATAYNSQSSRFFDIDGEKLANEVCDLAKSSLNTKPIETNDYDVVLDYYAAVGLLQTYISAFNGENVLRGRSILKDKLGSEIANPTLSIIDNPLLDKGMYTSKCDGEGSVSRKTSLIKDGVLNSFIYDIYNANKVGEKTTSNGLRGSYFTTPMIAPTNLEFEFGEMWDLSEIKNGVLTTSVLGAHTANPISGDFSVEAS
ncbi:MAG: TldD/PmbA family protein, partial [Methanobrevibacter sp.]|nr:TldD/PmbA family protein [Methanobrevibacter sp.]